MKIMTVAGTRPEAIKLAPLVAELNGRPQIDHLFCLTGQHEAVESDVLHHFGLRAHIELPCPERDSGLYERHGAIVSLLGTKLAAWRPDWIVYQGDTLSAHAAASAGFLAGIKGVHVEAGLRSHDLKDPFPEEFFRRMMTLSAHLHAAPTPRARENLLAEGIDDARIIVTGNTGVDALTHMRRRLRRDKVLSHHTQTRLKTLPADKRIVLMTSHRREGRQDRIPAMLRVANHLSMRDDLCIIWVRHRGVPLEREEDIGAARSSRIRFIDPQDYPTLIALLERTTLLISDSGGLQEEGTALGLPMLVTRKTTERPEAIAAGTALLCGYDEGLLLSLATYLLDDAQAYAAMARPSPAFGDGRAARRIADFLQHGPAMRAQLLRTATPPDGPRRAPRHPHPDGG